MAKFFIKPFATAGTKTAIPDATDSSGYVSYNEGYGADYSRVLGTDPLAKAIERTKLNAVLYDITNALQQYQTHGVPDFITTADNGGTAYPYSIYSIVRYNSGSGFHNYMSLKDNNTSLPTVTSDWKIDPFSTDIAALIHAATSKSTPVDADELGIIDSAASYGLKKLTWANLKTALQKDTSYKNTPVSITSWSYSGTTITLNVASHTFVAGDYIEVQGLTATTYPANGVFAVTSVTSTTIVYTLGATPTGTAGVSSATVKGYATVNGRVVDTLGVNQTWQDVTASRALGTIYTNTTGKPIMVSVRINTTSVASIRTTGGTIMAQEYNGINTSTIAVSLVAIVPPSSTYYAQSDSGTNTLIYWAELR